MAKLTVNNLEVRGKRVFVRVDYNVPLEEKDGQMVITDATRIVETLPTLRLLTEQGGSSAGVEADFTVIGLIQSRQQTQQRGLAYAVGTDQPDALARIKFEADVLEQRALVKSADQS